MILAAVLLGIVALAIAMRSTTAVRGLVAVLLATATLISALAGLLG